MLSWQHSVSQVINWLVTLFGRDHQEVCHNLKTTLTSCMYWVTMVTYSSPVYCCVKWMTSSPTERGVVWLAAHIKWHHPPGILKAHHSPGMQPECLSSKEMLTVWIFIADTVLYMDIKGKMDHAIIDTSQGPSSETGNIISMCAVMYYAETDHRGHYQVLACDLSSNYRVRPSISGYWLAMNLYGSVNIIQEWETTWTCMTCLFWRCMGKVGTFQSASHSSRGQHPHFTPDTSTHMHT